MLYNATNLDENKLEAIQKLEKDLGKTFLAFTAYDVKTAALSDDELTKVKALESELAISLIAVEA